MQGAYLSLLYLDLIITISPTHGATFLRVRGRNVGIAEYGSPQGWPLLLFQGAPTSRLPHNPLETRAGARIIVVERPGYGGSDFLPGRSLREFPNDVSAIVAQLNIARFSVVGVSAGGPHALACGAHPIAERIVRIGVVSGVGPFDAPEAMRGMSRSRRVGAFLAAHAPFVLRPLFWAIRNPSRNPERFVDRHSEGFSASDLAMLRDPAMRALRIRSYAEATRPGVRGFAHEAAMLARPWGFELGDVTPEVCLWHGEDDASTPVTMARHVAAALPRCRAVYYPGEGHFVAARHWDEIVSALAPA